MSRLTGKELAEAFSDYVNSSDHEHKELVEGFNKQHRTLQQSMMRAMMTIVENCAQPDYGRDGRNEGTHQLAKKLVEGFRRTTLEGFAAQRHEGKPSEGDINYSKSKHCVPSNGLGFV